MTIPSKQKLFIGDESLKQWHRIVLVARKYYP